MTLPDPWSFNPQAKYQEATDELRKIGTDVSKMGTRIMTRLWDVWQFRLFQIVGEYDTFEKWIHEEVEDSYDNKDYLQDFVIVTERVFEWVHRNNVAHPVTNERITVPGLIEAPKLIAKLKMMSQAWNLANDAQRREMLTTALTPKKTREDIKDIRDSIIGGRVTTTFPVWEQILPNGRTIYHCYAETLKVADLIKSSLGRAADIQQSEPHPW